ncbi:MAG: 30S ribosomal protein S17e [Candidatus Nezhaarchaeales archaeon]
MGKVRPHVVKRLAERLIEQYGDRFSLSFDDNKKLVAELSGLKAKHLRNRVAGYVTRLIKIRMRRQAAEKLVEAQAIPSSTPSTTEKPAETQTTLSATQPEGTAS